MRLKVKRWGNGLAVRLPRTSPEFGRLQEGMEVDATLRLTHQPGDWKPFIVRSPIPDPSQHIEEIRRGDYDHILFRRRTRGHR